jgi:serine/threonine-protein kinase
VSGSILELPCQIGDITLVDRLGAGGMAEVFVATRGAGPRLTRVVVKRMLPHLALQSQYRALFRREAATGLRVKHPHVVRTLDLVESPHGMMLVVEYVDGLTLRALARAAYERRMRLPLPVLLRMMHDAALGLGGIHATTDEEGLSFLHRDVSPDNLIVDRDGRTRVLDFGIARPGGELLLTRTGEIRGKLPYMSPEQIDAKPLDGRSDLYALGVTLFWMLTGRRPFTHASEIRLMQMILYEAPPDLTVIDAKIPGEVNALVKALLAKDKNDRPSSAKDVAAALLELGAGSAAEAAAAVNTLLDPSDGTAPVSAATPANRTHTTTVSADAAAETTNPNLFGDDLAAPTLDESSEWGKSIGHSQRIIGDPTPAEPHLVATPPPTNTMRYALLTTAVACAASLGVVWVVRNIASSPAPTTSAMAPTTSAMAPTSTAPTTPTTPTPPATTPTTPTPPAAPAPATTKRPPPSSSSSKRAFRVSGAPASVVWRAGGKVVGRGDAELLLSPGTKTIEGTDAGVVVVVGVIGNAISFAELPRGTLSVRGHSGRVVFGGQSHEVPARITALAGTWNLRHITDHGTTTHKVVVRPGSPSSPTVLSLVVP